MIKEIYNPATREYIIFKESALKNGGARSVIEIELQADSDLFPEHIHPMLEEHIKVLEGKLCVMHGNHVHNLNDGDEIAIPSGEKHRYFTNEEAGARIQLTYTPGTVEYEQFLIIAAGLAADGLTNSKGLPKSLRTYALLANMCQIRMAGFLGVADGLLKWIGDAAEKNGHKQELIDKYCSNPATVI